jgi:uncharacterized membrane protein YhaH (DUF805 family)|tara:strand:- start:47 stop:451 length:405 start_codon:yes stop_codon:yes gene_type:complete
MEWFIKCIKNYTVFKGRSSREEFWNFMLFWVIFYVLVVSIDKMLGGNYINFKDLPFSNYIPLAKLFDEVGLLTLMYRPLTLLPSLAAISRRLHDINRSGWWCLMCVTPLVIILIVFLCKKGDEDENQFGQKPSH